MADLVPYKGPLSPREAAAGINASIANARRLLLDAERLLTGGSIPTAASIAALSIEESGKVSIIRRLTTARQHELKSIWRSYRSHTAKNAAWILPQLVARGARELEDFRALFDSGSDHPDLLDSVKQLGFYTDCLGNRHWSIPADVIDEKLASQLVDVARILCPKRDVTARELELWVQFLGPHGCSDFGTQKQALVAWHEACVAEGLVSPAQDMRAFVDGGVPVRAAQQ